MHCICEDAIRCVHGEGMPIHKRPQVKGNLFVKFEIIFPPNNFVDSAKITVSMITCCSVLSGIVAVECG